MKVFRKIHESKLVNFVQIWENLSFFPETTQFGQLMCTDQKGLVYNVTPNSNQTTSSKQNSLVKVHDRDDARFLYAMDSKLRGDDPT